MGELKERMSYPEFLRWRAFYRHEPLGGERLDLHMAMMLKALIKLLGNQDVELDRLKPQFWPLSQENKPELSPEQLRSKIMQVFGAYNDAIAKSGR